MIEDPKEIPNPLQSAIDAETKQRPRRPRPQKKRSVVAGEFLSDRPRKKPLRERASLREKPYIDPELVARLAICGKWVKHYQVIRYAIWHCIRATPQLSSMDDRTLWDRLGRWGSETRSVKSSEEISGRHMALGHLQRLEIGVRGIEANPVRSRMLKSESTQYLKAVVLEWKAALESYLAVHPELMQTPDEFAGFVALQEAPHDVHKGMLDKPAIPKAPATPPADSEV
jgi:hypothetical protein